MGTVHAMTTATTPKPHTTTGTPQGLGLDGVAMPQIWTLADIARFYRRSTRQAARVTNLPGFPQPLQGDSHRWWADDVIEYARGAGRSVEDQTETLVHQPTPSETAPIRRPGLTPNQQRLANRAATTDKNARRKATA